MSLEIKKLIQDFSSISLKEMDSVALMKRTDTKFLLHENQLLEVLQVVKEDYQILEIKGDRIMSYSSQYYDTETNKFYLDHHNGRINRTKIRIRKYVESAILFLEIKQKDGKGVTHKSRTPIEDFEPILSEKSNDFITKITSEKYSLRPTLKNNFNRITLVSKPFNERVTLDFNLSYSRNGSVKNYENLVIIEIKQERFNGKSPFVKALRINHLLPYTISKYCIGMVSLYKNLKYNSFKRKLLKIKKITA